jgi:MinD superfamily P-loop ATPase
MGDGRVCRYAETEGLPVLMEIPFDRRIAEAYSRGEMIIEAIAEWKEEFKKLYHRIEEIVNQKGL